MKIVSFNVNGIRASVKKGLIGTIREIDPDVVGFQEIKAFPEQMSEALSGLNGYQLFINSAERPGYSGTALISKIAPVKVTNNIGVEEHDKEGRVITAEYDDFFLVNSYVPNSGQELARLDYRMTWDRALLKFLKSLEKKKPVIFMGDLNVAHKPIDIARPKENYNKTSGYTQKEIDGLDALMSSGFVDTFRHFYPQAVKYSWWSQRFGARAKNIGWRIDYVLVSPALVSRVKESFILNEIGGSDHCPVGIVLDE
ncbi:MAG: exodeoxyribonuclease III [Crocinitomicaceae bacterium]|nr:exodeoxyribonuclease III [Crocinitomicaceae bacterium]